MQSHHSVIPQPHTLSYLCKYEYEDEPKDWLHIYIYNTILGAGDGRWDQMHAHYFAFSILPSTVVCLCKYFNKIKY
jgi:hypothetical protein